ncbi:CDP-alcohol phosphatidyltransferase-domain-containing protein [Whalleya microplaca]|nr:CDP-alcohol phosphatidyltransferase-domain-containing protein [Whalleya microplaca]
MNARALRGGAHASRNCPAWGQRLSLLNFDRPLRSLRVMPTARRTLSVMRMSMLKNQNVPASVPRHSLGRDCEIPWIWPGHCRVGPGTRFEARRYLSLTPRSRREQEDSKDQPPARPVSPSTPPAEPRGIRKVIPKVIPSLASLTPHENIYTVPNLLTFSRLIAAPFIGYAILHDAHAWALGLFVYAGVSDLLDGWIARRYKLQTVVGSIVDPMADKLLMTVLTVCLATKGLLPVWLAVLILGRDVGLGISAIYYRWISLPPPKTFTRYWDFSLPSAEVRPTTISKYNTFLQLGLMGATMVTPVVGVDVGVAMAAFQYLVATTTLWSGLSYVFSKDAVKILSDNSKSKSKK